MSGRSHRKIESLAAAIFPRWPDKFADDGEKEKEEMVSVCIKRVLESASRSSTVGASRLISHSPDEIDASTRSYVVPPGGLYFNLGLDTLAMNFRLLELLPPVSDDIECALKVSGRPESASYDALSYVWGAPTPTKSIIVNGVEKLVGANLETLSMVDALCIDQMNDEEKGWQVAMMADIYHHADNVLIYLGDEDDDTAALFAFLNRTHDLDNESSIDDIAERCSIGIEDLLTSYHKFTLRPWFTRIWVCQEFSAAKNLPTWVCGPFTASTPSLQRDMRVLFTRCTESQILWTADKVGDLDLAQKASFEEFASPLIEATRILFQPGGGHFYSIPRIMYPQIKRDCTDPRDVVYGLRGLFEPAFRDAFYPNYTITLDELFSRLSSWLLILDHWGDVFYSYPRRMSRSLPSWVRDFSQRPVALHTP
ncbi:heterokaryon incompatibility protein-domain-containing protein [Leptodontidium sp. 2 PMI_412]|nr:heterokaryon incompatibility protein-domain-containing protein [Leptodontidium sp. 2 PMI_412]